MPKKENKPRLDQYRVGSILEYRIPERDIQAFYQIVCIDKLKKAPATYAVHFWKIGTPDPTSIYETNWNGAHEINFMLDTGTMKVASY